MQHQSGSLRVGVIGLGYGGEMALKGYSQLPNVEIVALAGLEEEKLHALGTTYSIPNLYRYHHELLSRDDLDAVSVCVPNYLHAPIAIEALGRGCMSSAKNRLHEPPPRPRQWSKQRRKPIASYRLSSIIAFAAMYKFSNAMPTRGS